MAGRAHLRKGIWDVILIFFLTKDWGAVTIRILLRLSSGLHQGTREFFIENLNALLIEIRKKTNQPIRQIRMNAAESAHG